MPQTPTTIPPITSGQSVRIQRFQANPDAEFRALTDLPGAPSAFSTNPAAELTSAIQTLVVLIARLTARETQAMTSNHEDLTNDETPQTD